MKCINQEKDILNIDLCTNSHIQNTEYYYIVIVIITFKFITLQKYVLFLIFKNADYFTTIIELYYKQYVASL